MSILKVVIADDEAPARSKMRRMLGKFENVEIVGEAADGIEALQVIRDHNPDVAFLDIEMPGLHGIEVAEEVSHMPTPPYIVFATAYNEHAIKAFELNAIDYLLKPVSEERLEATIDKLSSMPRKQLIEGQADKIEDLERDENFKLPFSNKIPIPTHDRYKLIDYSDVVCIEVEERNTLLYTTDKSYVLNQTLDYFEKKLPPELFLRVNRSSLIGLQHVKEIVIWFGNRFKIVLNTGKEVIASREKSRILKQVLKF